MLHLQHFTKNDTIFLEGVNMDNLFNNINNKNKEKILKYLEATTLTFKKNTNIYSSINDKNTLVIIEYGSIKIIRNDYNGNRLIVDNLNKYDIFGSIILPVLNQEYDIITKEDTKIILIDYDRIINYKNNSYYYNQFIQNLLKVMTNKITEKNNKINILTKRTIRDKLLEYFKILSKKSNSKIIYIPITFTELADYLSVDRCAMSRELKYLKDEGFIKITQRKITLLY